MGSRKSGFMSFQQSVQAFVRKAASGSDIPTINVAKAFPENEYKKLAFWNGIGGFYGECMGGGVSAWVVVE